MTVAAALDDYERNVMATTPKQTSRRNRVRVLRRALRGFENRAVASMTRGDLIKRLDQIQAEAGDVSRNRAQIRAAALPGMVPRSRIVENIALDRVRRGVRETPRDRVLSDDELRVLLKTIADERLRLCRLAPGAVAHRDASERGRDVCKRGISISMRARSPISAEVSKTRRAHDSDAQVDRRDASRPGQGLARAGYYSATAPDSSGRSRASRRRSRSWGRPCRQERLDGLCMTYAERGRPGCISRKSTRW